MACDARQLRSLDQRLCTVGTGSETEIRAALGISICDEKPG